MALTKLRSLPVLCAVTAASGLLACGAAETPQSNPTTSSTFLSGAEDAAYERGMRASLQGDAAEAEAHFRDALAANPRYLAAHLALGDVLLEQARFEEARAHYRAAVALRSTSVYAHLGDARATLALGEVTEAVSSADQSVRLAQEYGGPELLSEARTLLAEAYEEAGLPDDAVAAYEAALSALATATRARTRLARLYDARGERSEAVRLLRQGEAYLNGADDYASLAAAYVELGVYSSAMPLLQTARALDPSDDDVLSHFALAAVRVGEAEAAIDAATELLARAPDRLDAYVVRAEGRWRRGLVESARGDLAQVFSHNPDHFGATLLLADIEAGEGDDDAAAAHFAAALTMRPGDGQATARAAEFYADRGRFDDVVSVLAPVIALDERTERWLQLYSEALVALGRHPEAVAYMSAYAEHRPQDHALHLSVARQALQHPGALDTETTLRHARLALEACTGAPLTYRLTLIDALLAAGATGEARDVLELAEGAFPGAVELRERRNQL